MRIQHNITALNAANRLKANENTVSKNIAKLSSGYRINSAADDAAGLAVSEKMRKQINGLSQAEDNTKNGISLIQTAEGGLNETSSILQRMNTLAVESSNGTYKDEDRKNLQMEISSLETEIDRISTSTKFNEISLLNGDLSANSSSANAVVASQLYGATISTTTAKGEEAVMAAPSTLTQANTSLSYTLNYQDSTGKMQQTTIALTTAVDGEDDTKQDIYYSINGAGAVQAAGVQAAISGGNYTFAATDIDNALKAAISADTNGLAKSFTADIPVAGANSGKLVLTSNTTGTDGEHLLTVSQSLDSASATNLNYTRTAGSDTSTTVQFSNANVYTSSSQVVDSVFTVGGNKFAFVQDGTDTSKLGTDVYTVTTAAGATHPSDADVKAMGELIASKTNSKVTVDSSSTTMLDISSRTAGSPLVFQVGAENVSDQRATLNIDNMNSASLGLTAIDISGQQGALAAIDIISSASAKVSTVRANLGALQNELEHTANNLGTMTENLTSAESTIRDVDMTDEYVQYSKNQILSQAANAMLAQANTQPQNVLSLLKG